ncbi:MAG: metallophosphoesterase [bacterium]|nr:metallophosphoesterase [bacterium]
MRTIFIGDIHGCADELDRLLKKIAFQSERDRLFLTGDAFTKGPAPRAVWDQIQDTNAHMVMGNHDAELLVKLLSPPHSLKLDHQRILDALAPIADKLIPWLQNLPLYIKKETFLLVHAGIHPEKGLEGTSRDQFLAIRTWPPQSDIEGQRWHDVYRPNHTLIVFGHDAPGDLVIKRREDDTPYLIGLDSGCVYGNQLTAYILEEDRIEQVQSTQPRAFKS